MTNPSFKDFVYQTNENENEIEIENLFDKRIEWWILDSRTIER